jgi:hypothetical protein
MALSFGGAVVLSKWRRSTINAIGIGAAVVMLISLFLFALGESYILTSIIDPAFNDLVSEVFHSITTSLVTQTVLLLILGLIAAIITYFSGRSELDTGG